MLSSLPCFHGFADLLLLHLVTFLMFLILYEKDVCRGLYTERFCYRSYLILISLPFVVLLHVSRVYILQLLLLCCLPAAGGKGMSLITRLLITGLDWNPKICFIHCGMQLPSNNYLDFSNFHAPGMHSNCSTIRAGDQLGSYTMQ